MHDFLENLSAICLTPGVQNYAWGTADFIPSRFGYDNPDAQPFAEVWMGTHPASPAQVRLNSNSASLRDLIAAAPASLLGKDIAAAFGELPFLFKVLSAAKPLSIQVHPNKAQAVAGFAREQAAGIPLEAAQRNYKDRKHKCEMSVAITDMYLLAGFRPIAEIAENLALFALPEELPELSDSSDSLRGLFAALLSMPQDSINRIIDRLVIQLTQNRQQYSVHHWQYWLLEADAEFARDGGRTRDRGLFAIPFLQLIHLQPQQAVYLPTGTLHAYLRGNVVELMANSNNVLRSGLTAKHIDVSELLQVVDFSAGAPGVMNGRASDGFCRFDTPAEEFMLSLRPLESDAEFAHRAGNSAEILLILTEDASTGVRVNGELQRGSTAVFVPPMADCKIQTDAAATLFRAASGRSQ